MTTHSTAPPGWEFLLTAHGLASLSAVCAETHRGSSPESVGARLRRDGFAAEQVAALLTQADLRRKAGGKFGELAEHLLFTPAGLEQATRHRVATMHAERFRAADCGRVTDLGSGIAAESLALLAAGIQVTAVEVDPFTAAIAAHNLRVAAEHFGADVAPQVVEGDAEHFDLSDTDAVFFDPARRTAGHTNTRRVISPDDYSPSLAFAFQVAARLPTGIKLGPGTDRSLIPAGAEAQWVSVDGQLVEMGLWFGELARPGVGRAALIFDGTSAHELTAPADAADADVHQLGEYLYEPDGAVIRARLLGLFADSLDAGHVSDGIAYLTGDRAEVTPFASTFRIIEELPVREKHLRQALAQRGIGKLEIKKRGADIDPAQLRTRLKLRGENSGTLILTRAEGRHIALLAERIISPE